MASFATMKKTSQFVLALLFSLIVLDAFVIRAGIKFLDTEPDRNPISDAPGSYIPKVEHPQNTPMIPIPLAQLAQSNLAMNISCPDGFLPILDTIHTTSNISSRKIPRTVHITSKSRCATPKVHKIVDQWRFSSHSLYFHDDDAIERLTSHPLSQASFPILNETLKCVTNGATKSDLWRYLVLYTYGGIYSDIDNLPMGFKGDTIQDSDDAFFVMEGLGIMSQFFMASSPSHPLMKASLESGMESLRRTVNVMRNNPAKTTGPAALKNGFIAFMNGTSDGYIEEGRYVGLDNQSVTVVGRKSNSRQYVDREGLDAGSKSEYYKAMGMEHFHDTNRHPSKGRISCMEHLKLSNGTNKVANYVFDGEKYVDVGLA